VVAKPAAAMVPSTERELSQRRAFFGHELLAKIILGLVLKIKWHKA
jgi:hypothetical protein